MLANERVRPPTARGAQRRKRPEAGRRLSHRRPGTPDAGGPQGSGHKDLSDLRTAEERAPEKTPFRKHVAAYGKRLAPDSGWSLAPGVGELRHYRRSWPRADLVAGVTIASIAIPQSLGMAELAGLVGAR